MTETQSDVALSIEEKAYAAPKYNPALPFRFDHSQSAIDDAIGIDLATKIKSVNKRIFANTPPMNLSEAVEGFFSKCTKEDVELLAVMTLQRTAG